MNFSLGVHLTQISNEITKFGPSVDFSIGSTKSMIDIMKLGGNRKFFQQLMTDAYKSNFIYGLWKLSQIYKGFNYREMLRSGRAKSLVRTPLVDTATGKFEKDFIIKISDCKQHYHLLNVQSPGFTSSLALSEHVFEKIKSRGVI